MAVKDVWAAGTPKDLAKLHLCQNKDISLAWNLNVPDFQTISSVKWVFEKNWIETVAELKGDTFTVNPKFTRVTEVSQGSTNAGLELKGVKEGGRYTVQVLLK